MQQGDSYENVEANNHNLGVSLVQIRIQTAANTCVGERKKQLLLEKTLQDN